MVSQLQEMLEKAADELKKMKINEGYIRTVSLDGKSYGELDKEIAKNINIDEFYIEYTGHDYSGWKSVLKKVFTKIYDERGLIIVWGE